MAASPESALPLAWLNGEFVPFSGASLPVYDLGLVQGATVTERLRTVGHRPYLVQEHLDRLQRSLEAVRFRSCPDSRQLAGVIEDIVRHNTQHLPVGADLSVVVFVTAGQALGDANGLTDQSRPTVCLYTAPLPLAQWAVAYREGLHLVTPAVQQLSAATLSPQIKHRSRLHWYLAEQQARETDPRAMALLLDEQGHVTETSSGNLFLVQNGQLLTPSAETTLPGIAQQHVIQLAEQRGWQPRRAYLSLEDVLTAEEVFLTSSTYCLLPVSRINSRSIGTQLPGRMTKCLLDAWSEELGLDLQQQALSAES